MTTGPRYETARELTERTGKTDTVVCTDCGVFVMDKTAHTRFHAILSGNTAGDVAAALNGAARAAAPFQRRTHP